ncbi:hypothetical protein BV25DRAFT_1842721 [Artomyces pyxidatus]|uniref:Uncharacterized protein n=1 Tax=Artomyces pyxidatus TaxID=48021 RepID=A0ACB8SIY3_9AGAM|nr:hypothetical protein BV25DRAFT_1842721 [Artomyces pyxidatus]
MTDHPQVAAHHPQAPPAQRWYVVFRGTQQGIYTDWATAAANVIGVTGAIHRRYGRLEDAQAALEAFNMQEMAAADALTEGMQGLVLGPGAPPPLGAAPAPAPADTTAAAANAPAAHAPAAHAPAAHAPAATGPAHTVATASDAHGGIPHTPSVATAGDNSDDAQSINDDDIGTTWFNVQGGLPHAATHAGSTGSGTGAGSVYGNVAPSVGTAGSVFGGGSAPAPSVASVSTNVPSVFAPLVAIPPVIHGLPSNGRRFYAVVRGRQTGIFDSPWHVIRTLVRDYPGAIYRPFRTLSEASHWFVEQTEDQNDSV